MEVVNNERALVGGVILASIVPYTSLLPQFVSYGLVFFLFTLTVIYGLLTVDEIRISRYALLLLAIIWGTYVYHLIISSMTGSVEAMLVLRAPVFVMFSFIGLFLVPRMVSREFVYAFLSRMSAGLLLIGLPTAILGEYSVFGLTVSGWRPQVPLYVIDGQLWSVSSVFSNPNPFGFVLMIGSITALWEFIHRQDPVRAVLLVLNVLGVYLCYSRRALFTASIGLCIVLSWMYLRQYQFDVLVVSGAFFGLLGGLLLFGVIPNALVDRINLAGRRELWELTLAAIEQRPIFGHGPGDTGRIVREAVGDGGNPHNSYLRMGLTTGLVGATAYFAFVGTTVVQTWRRIDGIDSVVLFALVTAITIGQFFEAYSLFGLSVTSVVSAILFGFGNSTEPDIESVSTRHSAETQFDRSVDGARR